MQYLQEIAFYKVVMFREPYINSELWNQLFGGEENGEKN